MTVEIRSFEREDAGFLKDMLYEAIYVPSGQQKPDRSILQQEMIRRYYQDFGRKGDMGLLAELYGDAKGMVWTRQFSKDKPGYGFVSEEIPELSIAICPAFRGQGIGRELLVTMLKKLKTAGYKGVSLSSNRHNPSIHLYASLGFEIVEQKGDEYVMLKKF